jgi:regulator of RNase E activity RraA
MGVRLTRLGAKGAVIDGRIRDLGELRATGLPIFSRDVGISAANNVAYPAQVGVPVTYSTKYGDILIEPGDLLVGDENGVAHIPMRLENDVMELLPKLKDQDDKVRKALEDGQTATEAFKLRLIK